MSTRYNTGNPIESTDVRDMSDNAKNFDEFSNSTNPSFNDRLGVARNTISGISSRADSVILEAQNELNEAIYNIEAAGAAAVDAVGFERGAGDFVTGFTVMPGMRNVAWLNPAPSGDNNLYSWSGEVPPSGKVVPPNSTPETTGGFVNGWVPRTDETLRGELAAHGGAGLVGFQQSGTGAVARTAESKLREIVSIKDFGAKGDGVTDDTAAKNAMISALGYLVVPEGVFMVDRVACDGVVVGIFGTNRLKSILKSLPGSHTHTVEVSNDGGAVIRNITIDQNESAQTGGHGIRSAGCSILDISNVTIKNCKGYGIGLQAGTAKGVKIDNVLIDNTGSDGIDVKDYNFDNDVIQINNLTVTNYGRASSKQTAVDIRGPVNLTNLVAISTYPDTRAFRLRSGTVQGRPGSGTASNIYFKGQDGSSYAVQISNDVKDYTIHGVEAEGCGLIAIFGDGSEGYVTGLVGRNLLTEGCSIFSTGLTIDGLIVSGVASRAVDFEPTSRNNRITNFKFSGVGSANFVRIQSGSQNNQMVNGMVEYGKTPSVFAGTNATIQDVANFKTLYKGISGDILVDRVATKTFTFTHGLDVAVAPDLSSVRAQVIASTSGGQQAELGPVVINAVTPTEIEIVLKVITASPTAGAAVKVAIEASKYNGHP